MSKIYKDNKTKFDANAFSYLVKRFLEPIEESDACNMEIIDSTGTKLTEVSHDNSWAFTSLDRLVILLKTAIGEDRLTNMLSNYTYLKDIDPLFIINNPTADFKKVKDTTDKIITFIESRTYLPDDLYHDEAVASEFDKSLNYNDMVSKALTICTFLLYSIRYDRIPTTVEFDGNILLSVEATFNMRSIGEYDQILKFCNEYKLIENESISKQGMIALAKVSKVIVDGGILSYSTDRIENQSNNWKRLSSLK